MFRASLYLDDDLGDSRIKLRPGAALKLTDDRIHGKRRLVDALGSHSVKAVRAADDSGYERDILTAEPFGIARPVVFLVMGFRALDDMRDR